ncbi:dGTPase inhibitor [Klebsiella phage Kpn17]|uniref:DGTPase inhibitor n=1 Tax=Klebsiella phage Kpn17 TaxID=3044025 RepID=A0AAT9V6Y3_9CAUD|nr:dGTPase inhibitor [Klebsiella phage Kpn17]
MAMQTNYLFDGSTDQWSRLGYAERRLRDETMLSVVMAYHTWNHTVSLSVYEPRGELLVSKSFSRWSIDSASDWLAKLTADYSSWK